MSNNGWKEARWDLSPEDYKAYAELEKRENLHRFRYSQHVHRQMPTMNVFDSDCQKFRACIRVSEHPPQTWFMESVPYGGSRSHESYFRDSDRSRMPEDLREQVDAFLSRQKDEQARKGNIAERFKQMAAERPAAEQKRDEQERDR